MEKKVIKKILALLMIITILTTDFFVLGTNLITYAANQIETATNEPNIKFSAYFKNEVGEKLSSINQSIKNEKVKLYAEIQVEKEGYFSNGVIEIQNNNFSVNDEILSTEIASIKNNKINLKQINAGETVEVEIDINPIITEKVPADMLLNATVQLTGKYVSAQNEEGEKITPVKRTVGVNYQVDETAQAELITDIITNKVFSENDKTQTVVQLLIKSRLTENQYPVEQTIIDVIIPKIGEKNPTVNILAANARTEISNYTEENGIIKITLSNTADKSNQINWYRNGFDEIVVTFIYEGTVDTTNTNITANSEIKVYNSENTYKTQPVKKTVGEEINNTVMANQEITTAEVYKGQLYANTDMTYNATTTLVVTNENLANEIVVNEGLDKFILIDETMIDTDAKYVSTEINKQQLINLLGIDGNITIKNGETTLGEIIDISKIENENIVIEYTKLVGEIEITTSKPISEGILEIKHTKTMTENDYSREQIRTIKEVKTTSSVQGTSSVENLTEARVEIKETISKAELSIENRKANLSSIESNELILGITLVTDEVKYDLYKNPVITIQLPSDVEDVEFLSEPSKINASGFDKIIKEYDPINKIIKLVLEGEQKEYAESAATQAYIQLNLNVTLSQLATSHNDFITMTYTNENAVQYYNDGKVEQKIQISAPSKVITKFDLSSNENDSLTETILQKVEEKGKRKNIDFEIVLVNNEDTDIKNVQILGKLPTTGNVVKGEHENTLETILQSVNAPNAIVYYTENVNATIDTNVAENGWTTELSTLTNAKLYLIKIDNLDKGTTYKATLTAKLSNTVAENTVSYTQYEVIYDTQTETSANESSRKIGLMTSMAATIQADIKAQVGQDELKDGDIVKEGEVIKYTVTVRNSGTNALKNIQLNLDVPEGTTFVRPIPTIYDEEENLVSGAVYAENAYYEEITDSEQLEKLTNILISDLSTTQPYTIEYEVRVSKGTEGKEISNKSVVIYDETTLEMAEIKNIIKESNIRVTIKRTIDESIQLLSGGLSRYKVYVENLSNSKIDNLQIQLLSNGFIVANAIEVSDNDEVIIENQETIDLQNTQGKIFINSIDAKGIKTFSINGAIDRDITEMDVCALVNDNTGNKYRSNQVTEKLPQIQTTINLTTPQNGKYIQEGDIVNYTLIVTYEGDIEKSIVVNDKIPQELKIQSIAVNGKETLQCLDQTKTDTYFEYISNDISEVVALKSGESAKIEIQAKVGYISELDHGKVLTNYATTDVGIVTNSNSQVVTHILKSKSNENIENTINGLAWYDENENGKFEAYEKTLSGIGVKIYDLTTNSFLVDDFCATIEVKTDENGEYNFTKIKDGSYLIVFEYDVSQNEPTVSFEEGIDESLNSKVALQTIEVGGQKTVVSAIKVDNLTENIFGMNIGLKDGSVNTTPEQDHEQPDNPNNPENPDQPDNPEEPEGPNNPTKPEESKITISGFAWLDLNRNGQKDNNESNLSGIKVKIYNPITNKYITQENGKTLEKLTDSNGKYEFNNVEKGTYILVFEYDTEKYIPTLYKAEGVSNNLNSKVVLKNINIEGQNITTAVTDLIVAQDNVQNINIGLKENLIFDLQLNKYISRIVVQNNKGTKAYDYENSTFEKVEIHRKQIQNSIVILEYKIKIKNTGEIAGYVRNIVDYLPSGLTFSSELNTDWYLSENNLYTKCLENTKLNPGEEKEIKLILTKNMTNENVGLINNRAEIYQDYNTYGELDSDSKPNNQIQGEDDLGIADVIIAISTGGSITAYIILLTTNIILIGIAIKLIIKNRIITISTKKKGGKR